VLNNKGFTLVELLVVSTIFLVSVIAFTAGARVCLSSVKAASQLNKTVYVLQGEMERIKTIPFAQLIKLNGQTFAASQGKVATSSLLPDLVSIKVELKYSPNKNLLEIYTLRSKYE